MERVPKNTGQFVDVIKKLIQINVRLKKVVLQILKWENVDSLKNQIFAPILKKKLINSRLNVQKFNH